MKIEDIEFADAVISIPKNSVKITINVKSYEADGLMETSADFDMQDIRDAFERFEATISGEYPKYVITESGEKYLEELQSDG